MRQVITLHLGQAGIQIGQSFWELMCIQHGISSDGTRKVLDEEKSQLQVPNVMFDETRKGKFVSRSFWLDSDPIVIDEVKKSTIKQVNHPGRYFLDRKQHTTFFTIAQFSLNNQRQQVMDTIRKLVQACSSIEAIVITGSVSGGTGSGYLSSVLSSIEHSFPKIPVITFIIYPSSQYSSSIIEPYNALMAQTQIVNHSTANIMFTNEKMYDCCERLIGVDRPHFDNVNQIVAHVMSDVTAGQRFEGPETKSLQDLLTNLVPYKKMNSLMASYAPLVSQYDQNSQNLSVNTMTRNCFQKYHNLTAFKSTYTIQHDLCSSLLYRGEVSPLESQLAIEQVKQSESLLNLVSWSPTGINVSHCPSVPKYFENQPIAQSRKSCCLLANTTAIKPMFERVYRKYEMMYSRRAFVHWYCGYTSNDWFVYAKYNFQQMLRDYDQIV